MILKVMVSQLLSFFLGKIYINVSGRGSVVGIETGRSGDRMPMEARFSVPVQTGPKAHTAFRKMGTGSFPGVRYGRGLTLTPHPF
jgi:hypothetical protein